MSIPEWLSRHGGLMQPGPDAETRYVTFDGHPQYRLFATPAQGAFTCVVTQTNNGRRMDGGKAYPTLEAALSGGLEELRERLGW